MLALIVYGGTFIFLLWVGLCIVKDFKKLAILGIVGLVAYFGTNYVLKNKDLSDEVVLRRVNKGIDKADNWIDWFNVKFEEVDNVMYNIYLDENTRPEPEPEPEPEGFVE